MYTPKKKILMFSFPTPVYAAFYSLKTFLDKTNNIF